MTTSVAPLTGSCSLLMPAEESYQPCICKRGNSDNNYNTTDTMDGVTVAASRRRSAAVDAGPLHPLQPGVAIAVCHCMTPPVPHWLLIHGACQLRSPVLQVPLEASGNIRLTVSTGAGVSCLPSGGSEAYSRHDSRTGGCSHSRHVLKLLLQRQSAIARHQLLEVQHCCQPTECAPECQRMWQAWRKGRVHVGWQEYDLPPTGPARVSKSKQVAQAENQGSGHTHLLRYWRSELQQAAPSAIQVVACGSGVWRAQEGAAAVPQMVCAAPVTVRRVGCQGGTGVRNHNWSLSEGAEGGGTRYHDEREKMLRAEGQKGMEVDTVGGGKEREGKGKGICYSVEVKETCARVEISFLIK